MYVDLKVAAMSAAADGGFPKWVLLEPYLFRRDDDESFPDDTVAPIRASGTTSWGADFRIAFSLAAPPRISRLYAQMPGFPGPMEEEPLELLATHRHLALVNIITSPPSQGLVQNLFILRANENNTSLAALPPCTEPRYDSPPTHPRRQSSQATPRLLDSVSSGLWCGDKGEQFVVAELTLGVTTIGRIRTEAFADICALRSSFSRDRLRRCKWDTMRVPILSTTDDDLCKLSQWHTNAAIPFQRWLCWVDYHQGILFWDVSLSTVSFLWFPLDKYNRGSAHKTLCSGNGGVSVVDHGRTLKFTYVARHDSGPFYGALKPGTGFTITRHTLVSGDNSMVWKEEYTVTSNDLPASYQRGLPMFPRVDIDRPQVVHFLFIEFGKACGKMSMLSIDMSTKTVESFYLYMDGNEPLKTDDDADFIAIKSLSPTPMPFLSCDFPSFCCLSRKRKDME